MTLPILGGLFNLGQTWLEGKNKKTAAKAEAEAKVLVKAAESSAEWENIMAKATESSWKDEFLVIVLFIPAIGCFLPGGPEIIRAGFESLSAMPEYYQHFLYIAVMASFGVKGAKGFKKFLK